MSVEDADTALHITEAGERRVVARLRDAVAEQVAARPDLAGIDAETIDQLAREAAARAGVALWRISLAEATAEIHGIAVADALRHPSMRSAQELLGLDPEPEPEPEVPDAYDPWQEPETEPVTETAPVAAAPAEPAPAAPTAPPSAPAPPAEVLRVAAVHSVGIESLRQGDDDIELSLSDAGLDVLQRSTGAALGRLDWTQITGIDVRRPKRRLRRRKPPELVIRTGAGEAVFELGALSPEEIDAHVEPALRRLRAAGTLAS